ncbi:hypothetical protein Q9L58_009986 [Maublancomyces gigas]|uniref:Uncharacterized protein n=1 Tax=Discina gigas TaxID=1032678 RepID=A0ABR3G5C1_9PEZI
MNGFKAYLHLQKQLGRQMAAVGCQKKPQSGDTVYPKLFDWHSKNKYLRQLRTRLVHRRSEHTEASSAIGTAFQALIVNVRAKEQKSAGASDRQFRVQVADETDDGNDDEDGEEFEPWVARTNGRPSRGQAVLDKALGEVRTPPSDGFEYIENENYTIIDMPAEDSDHDKNMPVTKDGKGVGMPRTVEPFQILIMKV